MLLMFAQKLKNGETGRAKTTSRTAALRNVTTRLLGPFISLFRHRSLYLTYTWKNQGKVYIEASQPVLEFQNYRGTDRRSSACAVSQE